MSETGHRYFIIHKPYDMLSQFVGSEDASMLNDLDFDFPGDIHAVGRLDKHSEGLLILTTNKKVTRLLFQGERAHERTYLVRVKDLVTADELERLRSGIMIRIKGGADYRTDPCVAEIVQKPSDLLPRAIEFSDTIPHTWLRITLTQGKYHQVRKMVSGIRHRCQRLIRISIDDLQLGDLPSGGVQEMEEAVFFEKLKISFPVLAG